MQRKAIMERFSSTDIYGITAEEYSLGRSNIEVVNLLIAAGVKVIQYREKDKKAGQMYQECLAIREITKRTGVVFIVNDYIDLAMAVDADGVHIGQDDMPPEKVRQLVGPDMIIGLSTHAPEQARAAVQGGVVDYIGVGPIFATKTKKDVCQPVGFEYLQYVAENIPLPFVAIGGIKEHNIAAVNQCGAKLYALVTEIVGVQDIDKKVTAIRGALAQA